MDLFAKLSALKSTATGQFPLLDSKRKRETVLLLPFLAALGYDPFDLRDVEPEFPIPLEEGRERSVDYAAKKSGSPVILFHLELLPLEEPLAETGAPLQACDSTELLRDLRRSEARVGALTDGIRYRFYADLEPFYAVLKGEMAAGEAPFVTFNLLDCSEEAVEKLRPLVKPKFRAGAILSRAHHLKYTRFFRRYLQRQREAPDQAFVRFMMEQVHGGTSPKGDAGMYAAPLRDALRELVGSGGKAEGQAPTQKEETGETTEGGAGKSEGVHSEKTPDEEEGGSGSDGDPSGDPPIDKDFQEFFRKRLEGDQ